MKNRIRYVVAGLLLCTPCLIGCGGVQEQEIQVSSANDPLSEPRSLLARYAEGQAIGSEAMGYPALVENVRKTDPDRAAILEQGFEDLQAASPAKRKSIAEKLLEDLAPQMHADGPPADADEQPED